MHSSTTVILDRKSDAACSDTIEEIVLDGIPASYERTPPTKSRVMAAATAAFTQMGSSVFDFAELGEGAFSHVLKAKSKHHGDGNGVAVKILKYGNSDEDKRRVEMFKNEARIHSEVADSSLNTLLKRVPHVYEYGDVPEAYMAHAPFGTEQMHFYYMILERVKGEGISKKLASSETDFDEKIMLLRQAAEALAVTHESHYVHRDAKPDNFLLCDKKGVMICDFGFSIKEGEHTLVSAGSPKYMAPETVFPGELFPSADIFAWGIMIYEAFENGRHPFITNNKEDPLVAIAANDYRPPKSREMNNSGLWLVAMNCLSKNPRKRYANGTKLLYAFDKALKT